MLNPFGGEAKARRPPREEEKRLLICSGLSDEDGKQDELAGPDLNNVGELYMAECKDSSGGHAASAGWSLGNLFKKYQSDAHSHRRAATGLGWVTAALFIVADIAGGGVVTIPVALLNSGLLVGSVAMMLICGTFCYTAHLLGKNWTTMCTRWPDSYGRVHCRKPYPEMAFRAMGERARHFTSFVLTLMNFGVSVVYLLLAARILSELWASLAPGGSVLGLCRMVPLLAGTLLPLTFLKSPQDFWWVVVTAMLTTALAVLSIVLGSALDASSCAPHAQQPPFRVGPFFLSIGIFFFSFGGHAVFPTIQHDMRRPRKFTRSSLLAFSIVALMYVPISFVGYFVYGDSLHDSIISSIQTSGIQQIANLFIALHCILTLTVVINPVNQELEHFLHTPHHICWQRIVLRTGVMLAVVFVALTVPSFGPILNLIGGTTVALTSAILPCLFHLYLHADERKLSVVAVPAEEVPNWRDVLHKTARPTLALNCSVIVIAVLCGLAATNSALIELSTSQLSRPCYLAQKTPENGRSEALHCCGHFRNISRHFGEEPDFFTCPAYEAPTLL